MPDSWYLSKAEGEELDGDLDDLIDDNPVEEDGPDEVDSGDEEGDDAGAEKKHRHSDYEEDLEDEDYDLLEENLGIKVKRKVTHSHVLRADRQGNAFACAASGQTR